MDQSPKKLLVPWMFLATIALCPAPLAYAQTFSFGVKVGVPLTNVYTTDFIPNGGASASEQRFAIGPTAELHLPFHFSIEADALWRRSSFSEIGPYSFSNSPVNDWQFPILAKYELALGPFHPFADGGVVYRHVSLSGPSLLQPTNPDTAGVGVGAGITLKLLRLRLSPEIRYTRWPTPPFSSAYAGPVISTGNQVDLLVGFTF
jgi:hypothetical protein